VAALVRWLVPALILILLCALIVIHWGELRIHHTIRSLLRRRMAIALIATINVPTVLSVFLLVRFIINGGHSPGAGRSRHVAADATHGRLTRSQHPLTEAEQ
jgi:hypothetical protein